MRAKLLGDEPSEKVHRYSEMTVSGKCISSIKLTASQDLIPLPHTILKYFREKCSYLAFLALSQGGR